MDENKLGKLREVKYVIHKCCGNCIYSMFKDRTIFGLCSIHNYKHKKHTGDSRKLSINKYGNCIDHEYSKFFVNLASHFKEFLE